MEEILLKEACLDQARAMGEVKAFSYLITLDEDIDFMEEYMVRAILMTFPDLEQLWIDAERGG